MVGVAACGPGPRASDAAVPLGTDVPIARHSDSDGDGLCDATEIARGLDPGRIDTDGDGFSDLVELQLDADPLSIRSPDRSQLVTLHTDRLAPSSVALTYTVRGEGGSYVGGFSARTRPFADPSTANDFFASASAVAATPSGQVAAIEGERFLGVVGRTLFTYQVDFEYRGDSLIDCMRVYPFTYQVKLEDGSIVGFQARILLVTPRGQTPGAGQWCVPSDGCY